MFQRTVISEDFLTKSNKKTDNLTVIIYIILQIWIKKEISNNFLIIKFLTFWNMFCWYIIQQLLRAWLLVTRNTVKENLTVCK